MKKKYIIIFIVLVIYLAVTLIVFGLNNKTDDKIAYMMIDQDVKWKYKNKKWTDVLSSDNILYSMTKFNVYNSSKYLGEYGLTFSDKWYVFDDNRNSIKYDSLLAYTGDVKIDVIDYKVGLFDSSDSAIINKVLKENEIDQNLQPKYKEKIVIDLDGDEKEETLYMINNLYDDVSKSYGIVFVKDGNKIRTIYKEISKISTKLCMPYINNIIDINKDKKYEIIIGCGHYGNNTRCVSMFELKNGKYEKIKSCN